MRRPALLARAVRRPALLTLALVALLGGASPAHAATAPSGGRIHGTVRAGGSPLGGIQVQFFATSMSSNRADVVRTRSVSSSSAASATTTTGADGTYVSPTLGAASYDVEFVGSQSPSRATQWWQGVPSQAQATPVSVAVDQDVTGIDADLAPGASIAGTLTDQRTGAGLVGATVYVYDDHGNLVEQGTTQAGGAYLVGGLAAGSYVLQYVSTDPTIVPGWYQDVVAQASATPVAVSAGQALTGADDALHEEGVVAGTVSDSSGAVVNASVTIYDATGAQVQTVQTGSDGTYRAVVATPGQYRVRFTPPGGSTDAASFYASKTTLAEATPITVAYDQTTSAVDGTLAGGASIAGHVTDPDGGVCSDLTVILLTTSGSEVKRTGPACANGDGAYALGGLPAGTYLLRFVPAHPGPGQPADDDLAQYYAGADTAASATPITVTAGQAATGYDAHLRHGGRITGMATSDLGTTTTECTPQVSALDGGGQAVITTTASTANGSYALEGLPAGSYTVEASCTGFSGTLYRTTDYPASATRGGASAVAVTVPDTAAGVDLRLPLAQGLQGRVTDTAAGALDGVVVEVEDTTGRLVDTADVTATTAGGRWEVPVGAGSWVVSVRDPAQRHRPAYYGGTSFGTAARLAPAPLTSGVDVALAPQPSGGVIAGTVTDAAGPLAGVVATAYDAGGAPGGTATTAADGSYAVAGLAPGTWRVGFADPSGAHVPLFSHDEGDLAHADPVAVTEVGATTAGVDAYLARAAGGTTDPVAPAPAPDAPQPATSTQVDGLIGLIAAPTPVKATAPAGTTAYVDPGATLKVKGRVATIRMVCAHASACTGTLRLRGAHAKRLATTTFTLKKARGAVRLRLAHALARRRTEPATLSLVVAREVVQSGATSLVGA